MKCPMCSGKGMVDYPMYADDEHKWQYCVARMKKCDMCNGTGEVPMTNEEWFCSLSTKEKAEFLVKIELSAMHPVKRGAVDMDKFIEEVVDWLKNPHKGE